MKLHKKKWPAKLSLALSTALCLILCLGIFALGCSKKSVSQTTSPPEGSTVQNGVQNGVQNETDGTQNTSEAASKNLPDLPVEVLPVNAAIAQLQAEGHSGADFCGDTHRLETNQIPDYKERQPGSPVPKITPEAASIYALGAAAIVQKSYDSLKDIWLNPAPRHLLCISRLITQPRLEVEWNYLSYLIREDQHIRGARSPSRLAVPAIRSGEAIVFGCLEEKPYGNIYNSLGSSDPSSRSIEGPIIFETLLAWTGGRWRVVALQDHLDTKCSALPDFLEEVQKEIKQNDTSTDWVFGSEEWIWNAEEVAEWIKS